MELSGTHFTSDAEVKDNITFCSIQLNPLQYLSDFESLQYLKDFEIKALDHY